MAHDVFISYASKDKVVADAVCAALEADHIRCWIAPRDVLPGQKYAQTIVDAIHAAKVFVLVFSAASNSSEQVYHEVDRAVSCGLPVLPLRVDDVMPCDWLEYYLAGQHWLDALTPPLEDHLARLSEAITVLLQPPAKGARSLSKDEWQDISPEAAKPSPAEKVIGEPAPTVVSAAAVTEKPLEAVEPPVVPPAEAVRPRVVPPPATEKPAEAVRPRVVPPPVNENPAEAAILPGMAPPVTRTAPKVAKPSAASAAAPAASAPAASAPASVVSPKPLTAAKRPAKPGRRPALIAAAVVGASWLVVLVAVELLVR